MRKTDRCGIKDRPVLKFGDSFHKEVRKATDRITAKTGGIGGKKWWRKFKVQPKET